MQRATDSLEQEHRTIEKILRVIGVLADELAEDRNIDSDILSDLCQFLRIYGHQCHHGKEESYLFPMLESHGVPEEGCPLGALRHEHERSRALTQELAQASVEYAANPNAGRSALSKVFSNLMQFYPAHIWKEEYLLFPLARKVLSAEDDERLLKEFASVESDIFVQAHESYEQLAIELEVRAVKASPKMRITAERRVA
jgi:hemerythrin-like domain-containing protein